jgi:hypothetical protein
MEKIDANMKRGKEKGRKFYRNGKKTRKMHLQLC